MYPQQNHKNDLISSNMEIVRKNTAPEIIFVTSKNFERWTFIMDSTRSKGYTAGLMTMLFIVMGLTMLDRNLPLYIGSFIMKDLGLTNTQLGLMATAMGVGWGLSALIFGYFSDRLGRKIVVVPAVIIMSIVSIGTGLAPAFAMLFLARVLMGISEAPAVAILPGVVGEESAPGNNGRNIGWVMSSGALVGSFIAPIVGTALTIAYGWRICFFIIGVPGVIMGLLLWKFMKEPLSTLNLKKGGEKEKFDLKGVLYNKNVWLAAICSAMYTGAQNLFYGFGPLFLIVDKGLDPSLMSWVMGGCGFGNFLWMLITPWISDRIGRRNTLMIFGLLTLILPFSFMYAPSAAVLIPICFIFAFNAGLIPIIVVLVPAESVGPKLMGTAMGLNLLFGEILGGGLWPILGGVVADKYGYRADMWIYMALMASVAVWGFFMTETAPTYLAKKAAKLAAK